MYFKYAYLNYLRDELWLTLTMQKATLFFLLCPLIPAVGLGLGIAHGVRTHNLLQGFLIGAPAFIVGIAVAWVLPRTLWMMLAEFYHRGWFLQPTPAAVPTMSLEEFSQRSAAFDRGEKWRVGIALAGLFAWAFACCMLGSFLDRANFPEWINAFAVICFLATLPALILFQRNHHRRIVKKHGLACLNCLREITNAAGAQGVPNQGLCRHCGAKVIGV